ncbi:MAG: hypothetical protein WC874_04750, partial [Candidatus Izemoplasmatales bacterium]
MVSRKQLALVLGDETKVKIIQILFERKTLTQVFRELPNIARRESVYKSLQKLLRTGLIKRRFNENRNAYFYSINFKKIEINQRME